MLLRHPLQPLVFILVFICLSIYLFILSVMDPKAYWPPCEMFVGAAGVECAMSWSQCSILSTGHSAREFLWAEWRSITLCPLACPVKSTVIFIWGGVEVVVVVGERRGEGGLKSVETLKQQSPECWTIQANSDWTNSSTHFFFPFHFIVTFNTKWFLFGVGTKRENNGTKKNSRWGDDSRGWPALARLAGGTRELSRVWLRRTFGCLVVSLRKKFRID